MLDVSERERRHSHTATFQTRNPGEAVLLLVVIILLLCLSLFYLFLCVSGEARSSTGVKAPGPARRGTARKPCLGRPPRRDASHEGRPRARATAPVLSWSQTDGVNTHGAAAKVMKFVRLGKKVRLGTFEKIKAG